MKTNISKHIRLGIFVSLGVAAFIFGIFFIGGEQQLFRSTFRISGVFRDVAGLQPGNNVRLSGITVGVVDDIRIISDTTVRVDILVDERTRQFIRKDAIASIGSEGLMGNKTLILSPGTGGTREIEEGDIVETVPPMMVEDLLLSLKGTIDNTSKITSDLADITGNIQSGRGTIGRLLMDRSWRQNFDSTFTNVKEGSSEFRMLMKKVNGMDDVLVTLRAAIENTSSITSDLARITANIQSGEGTLGGLLMDKTLKHNLDSTMVNLKEGSAEMRLLMEKARSSWLLWGF